MADSTQVEVVQQVVNTHQLTQNNSQKDDDVGGSRENTFNTFFNEFFDDSFESTTTLPINKSIIQQQSESVNKDACNLYSDGTAVKLDNNGRTTVVSTVNSNNTTNHNNNDNGNFQNSNNTLKQQTADAIIKRKPEKELFSSNNNNKLENESDSSDNEIMSDRSSLLKEIT